jgi:ABC-2 type transport system ATP-binding protein
VSPGGGPDVQPDQISFGGNGNGDGDADGDQKTGPAPGASVWGPLATSQGAAGEGAAPEGEAAQRAGGPDPGAGLAIATSGLAKRFRGQLAVAGIDLAVPRGAVYGFLGPNGSGKTTTIRMLLGLIEPTSGSHEMLGVPMPGGVNAVLPKVGSLVEGPAFYPQLSGRANLARLDAADRAASRSTAGARIDRALERVGLLAAAGKRFRAYSLGMKQRLAIAAGLLQPRELMILDEPTNGLDPQGTREVRSLIREIAAEGTTIFISSHLLAEVEQICSHVGVMRAGQLVFEGTLAELRGGGATRIMVRSPDVAAAAGVLAKLGLADVRCTDLEVSADLGAERPEVICAELVHAGVPVAGLATPRPSLEDRFVELTGEGFDVNG